MRLLIPLILSGLFLSSCLQAVKKVADEPLLEEMEPLAVPSQLTEESLLIYHNNGAVWTLEGKLYSGYIVSYYPNGSLQEKFGVLNGKKQNEAKGWYPNGELKFIANYYDGKLHGEKKSWAADSSHNLVSHLNYHLGKAHGLQQRWYPTGEIFKILHFSLGKEEGLQQAFRKNGDLFANYEARAGRVFGLKRSNLCFGLDNEAVIY